MRQFNLVLKRIFDVVCSALGIVILSPLLLILTVAVKLSSPGPALFRQERLGRNGKPFSILKYRSMVLNAEKIGDGISINSEDDPRITRVGRFLRATSLDELPQLFNVFMGTMSLVGPRPPVTYHPYDGYDNYPEWAKKRFRMRPGITGLAQATMRNAATWEERFVVDNEYVDKFSFLFDIKILLLTVKTVLGSRNLY